MSDNILEVRDLKVWFPIKKGVFARTVGHVKAVDGVSFDIAKEALRLAAQKLPVTTKFVVCRDYDPTQNV